MKQLLLVFGGIFLCMGAGLQIAGNAWSIFDRTEEEKIKSYIMIASSTNCFCWGIALIFVAGFVA